MRQSQLFTKIKKEVPSGEVAKNAQLLLQAGFIHKEMAGVYSFLPLGLRVIENIKQIIRKELNAAGCQEMCMTALQSKAIWEKTNRWSDDVVDNWFKTTLKNGTELGLAFTHEESIAQIMSNYVHSYKDLPFFAYQFQTKFRNELRAKSGIMRGREFLMKDLYSFHTDKKAHDEFYEKMKEVYMEIFRTLGLGDNTYLTMSSGEPFSKYSFEFQTISEAGEDTILFDKEKKVAINKDDFSDQIFIDFGLNKDEYNFEEAKSIEIGDIYSLGTKYSEALNLTYADAEGKNHPVFMGSYGIGISRVMGTIVEVCNDKNGMIWPEEVAPFAVHLVSLCVEDSDVAKVDALYQKLVDAGVSVLYDDRDLRPGQKFAESDIIGIPHRVIMSKKTMQDNSVEYIDRKAGNTEFLTADDVVRLTASWQSS
ncbi:MAG: prolyl-tRNA synthetase [Candidatus Magasanikbacteria bacterium]|jgi:prolyl-tRNA synthetase|nr:prolyl-tRNA synthetase [Candidatus Magasanikbacteria bacterium]MBT5262896.1 prolyl-tRNA synthetase [Candidatus Magasanikbacteria bacterium]MBT5820023.1 prolyl-tRNA synthetase [Candidatus Magasanikbacteria bacterium]MBT6294695.1 prolyl-tRNA synthetase [Candidatus Magasanikbacteria bacterium]